MNTKIAQEACWFIQGHSCYEVTESFLPICLTFIFFIFGYCFALKRLEKQHQNNLAQKREETKREVRIKVYEDCLPRMKAASDFLSKTSSFIILRKHPIGDEPLGISLKELIDITKENSSHVHLLMTYSEQYQIIHPKFMETFRYALGNYSHLFGKLSSKHFTSANQVYSLPCAEEAHDLMLDAHCHIFDLQKGLQTIAFGDVFDTELVDRAPANPEFRVLSLDVGKLDSFHEYLLHDSPWGKEATKSEESAKRFFNQGRD